MEIEQYFIYALYDSFDRGIPKYVGQTKTPAFRFNNHVKHSRFAKTKKSQWVLDVQSRGGYIEIALLACCKSRQEANEVETAYISKYRQKGYTLVNSTNGGSGTKGYVFTKEHRANISKALMGSARHTTPHTLLSRQRMSIAHQGKKVSYETRVKMSQAHSGKKRTEEQKQNMREAWVIRKQQKAHGSRI